MADRRRWILGLLSDSDGKIPGRTRLMKLAFLLDRAIEKKGGDSPFEFSSYKHGPFDKKVLDILDELQDEGIIDVHEEGTPYGDMYVYELSDEGSDVAEKERSSLSFFDGQVLKGTIKRWSDEPTRTIIGYVYDSYPEFTPS